MNKSVNKELHQDLLHRAKVLGVGLVHIVGSPRGGLTIAFKPSKEYSSTRMVTCAINTCSIEDVFNKKIGAVGALDKFFLNKTIELPLLNFFAKEDVAWVVKAGFTALYTATTAQ